MKYYFVREILKEVELSSIFNLWRDLKNSSEKRVLKRIFDSAYLLREQSHKTKVVVFDLDGTVCKMPSSLAGIGKIYPEAISIISQIREKGFRVGIYTARPDEDGDKIRKYLLSGGLEIDFVNIDPESEWGTSKPLASVYVDDRAFRFSGDWKKDGKLLLNYIQEVCGD